MGMGQKKKVNIFFSVSPYIMSQKLEKYIRFIGFGFGFGIMYSFSIFK